MKADEFMKERMDHVVYGADLFAARFKEAFEDTRLHKQVLENDGICSYGALTNYIRGDRIPSGEKLQVICSYLNVSADWLLGLSDEKRRLW